MYILWVEDKYTDIIGFMNQCDMNGWDVDCVDNFYDAVIRLVENQSYDLVVIDIRLPWGAKISDEILTNYSEKMAGLRFLEAMRGRGEGKDMLDILGYSSLPESCIRIPVIMLSRVEDLEEDCLDLDVVGFFSKMDSSPREIIATIANFA